MLGKHYDQDCSIARTLELVGERWSLLVIRDVFNGKRRFEQMQDSLGVARNVLSDRLGKLVAAGILERRPYQERPPRFEYFLTAKGLDLWPTMIALLAWGDRHLAGPEGPPMVVMHKRCGGLIDDRRICDRCGSLLQVREARAVLGPGAPEDWPGERYSELEPAAA